MHLKAGPWSFVMTLRFFHVFVFGFVCARVSVCDCTVFLPCQLFLAERFKMLNRY